jgi:hypothetical protein
METVCDVGPARHLIYTIALNVFKVGELAQAKKRLESWSALAAALLMTWSAKILVSNSVEVRFMSYSDVSRKQLMERRLTHACHEIAT